LVVTKEIFLPQLTGRGSVQAGGKLLSPLF
jgi:hypothetical protein